MRAFEVHRDVDETGVSGTGFVAQGVVFDNGKVALCWLGESSSVVVWNKLADAERVHGHNGLTRFVWVY